MSFSSAMVISCAIDFSAFIGAEASIVVLGRMIGEGMGYLGRCIVGFLSDVIGDRRKFLLLGYGTIIFIKPVFIVCSTALLPQMTRIILYTSANITEKFFGSLRDPVRDAWLADYTPVEDLSVNLTFRRFLSYFGSIAGAMFSFIFTDKISYPKLFTIATIPAFLGVMILFKSIHNQKDLKQVKTTKNLYSTFIEDIKKTKMGLILIFLLIGIFLLFLGKINEFSLWLTARKSGIFESNSILFLVFYLSSCFSSVALSMLLEKFSAYILIIFAAIGFLLINSYIPHCLSYNLLIGSTIFYGLYAAFIDILTTYIVLKIFQKTNWKATIISILNLTIGISYSLAGILNKNIISHYGIIMPFKLSCIPISLGIIMILIAYFMSLNKKN
jgi:MFS family permease